MSSLTGELARRGEREGIEVDALALAGWQSSGGLRRVAMSFVRRGAVASLGLLAVSCGAQGPTLVGEFDDVDDFNGGAYGLGVAVAVDSVAMKAVIPASVYPPGPGGLGSSTQSVCDTYQALCTSGDRTVIDIVKRSGLDWTLDARIESEYHLGDQLEMSGDIIVAGAALPIAFTRHDGSWDHGALLVPDGIDPTESELGASVATDGRSVVVGAPGGDSAYVFTVGLAQQPIRLFPADAATGIRFGDAVAVENDLVIVGAPMAPDAGAVYVFDRASGAQTAKLEASSTSGADFGYSVAISGGMVIVGAPAHDRAIVGSGATYVYTREGQSWNEEALPRPENTHGFGWHVRASGDRIQMSGHGV